MPNKNAIIRRWKINVDYYKVILPFSVLLFSALNINHPSQNKTIELNLASLPAFKRSPGETSTVGFIPPDYEYQIQAGDNLSMIFHKLGFNYGSLMKVMATDVDYLALDTLAPGKTLRFWRSGLTSELDKMELQLSIADKVIYQLHSDGYEFSKVSLPGTWHREALVGTIEDSFSSSAYLLGLDSAEISQVVGLFKENIDFSKDLHAGDRFAVLRTFQTIDGRPTGKSQIEAVKLYKRGRLFAAYLHSDGHFYNERGESLQRAFQRYPVSKHWRMSSAFNPKRRHPVTGRIAPHNGTDWAVPAGTPIQSTGDGTVIMTRKHPYAGNYVVIEHSSKYKTRYLHLSKITVKKGQKVSRGQKIGLSGKTGRVTGPHLHYELIVHGRPVNAMTARIPIANKLSDEEKKRFLKRRDEFEKLINTHL